MVSVQATSYGQLSLHISSMQASMWGECPPGQTEDFALQHQEERLPILARSTVACCNEPTATAINRKERRIPLPSRSRQSPAAIIMGTPNNAMDIKPGYRGRAFTSDLTGQEFWLVIDKGFQPMGLVMGNCIYSMGAVRNWLVGIKANFQGELREYTQLMYQARELALSRMQFEADQLGADGVIGVDVNVEYMHNGEWMEVTAVGTAVRWVGSGPNTPPTGQGRVTIPAG
jgi:uncharacterized protein YbjQ (UPF0145 family)